MHVYRAGWVNSRRTSQLYLKVRGRLCHFSECGQISPAPLLNLRIYGGAEKRMGNRGCNNTQNTYLLNDTRQQRINQDAPWRVKSHRSLRWTSPERHGIACPFSSCNFCLQKEQVPP